MPTSPALPAVPPPGPPKPPPGYHGAVTEFKRRLIEATLFQLGGNRTQTARALGLQRTYLLRLIREFGVNVPHREPPGRQSAPVSEMLRTRVVFTRSPDPPAAGATTGSSGRGPSRPRD